MRMHSPPPHLPPPRAPTDCVVSLVHGDDCVPRLCMANFLALLEELAAFDYKAAEQVGADGTC